MKDEAHAQEVGARFAPVRLEIFPFHVFVLGKIKMWAQWDSNPFVARTRIPARARDHWFLRQTRFLPTLSGLIRPAL